VLQLFTASAKINKKESNARRAGEHSTYTAVRLQKENRLDAQKGQ
jgi:hypothetical protein